MAPRNGSSADGSNSRTDGRSLVLNVKRTILKRIYGPVTTVCRIFCTVRSGNFGSHLSFLLICGKYKLPLALHFVSRNTALQEITTINQQRVSHLPPFTKFLDKYKNSCPNFTFSSLQVTNFNLHFLEVKHIQFLVVSLDAAIFMLKSNCKQRLRRVFKRKLQ